MHLALDTNQTQASMHIGEVFIGGLRSGSVHLFVSKVT